MSIAQRWSEIMRSFAIWEKNICNRRLYATVFSVGVIELTLHYDHTSSLLKVAFRTFGAYTVKCICLSCSRGDSGCLEYGWEQPLVGFTLVYLCKWWDVWPQEQITLHDVGMSKIRQSDIAFFPTMGVKPCWRLEEKVYLYLWCLKYYGMEGCLICFALNVLQRTVSFNYGTMKVHWRSSKCCYSQASSTYF